eukprot:TRINITY_DN14333_c0_g2_i1.p1 TRINITY_DN14333_c0_g2~~TRINITY_DN14333_c0_g2_i1.p1  ORF type:complete len:947 (-),score=234.31 TRINITY_DN14333_c0_g2_i1:226-3066(-)
MCIRDRSLALLLFCALTARVSADCGGTSCITTSQCNPSAPRQGWKAVTQQVDALTATNIVNLDDKDQPVGASINCPGDGPCHAWGTGFGDRNGVLYVNGTEDTQQTGFTVSSWPLTKSLPVGPLQTPPEYCLTADALGSELHMKPIGPSCLVLSWDSAALKLNGTELCLDMTAPSIPPPPPFVGVTCGAGATNATFASQTFCNPALPVEQRVAEIVSQLTTDEKLSLLESSNTGVPRLGLRQMQFGEGLHGVDSTCGAVPSGATPDQFGERTGCATSYPSGIAEGATFNRSLWLAVGAADGREGRGLHNQKDASTAAPSGALAGSGLAAIAFWAPDMNLFRDPRWGRGQEVPGEDPVLTSEYVRHFSEGLQHGDGQESTSELQIISTCKHFFGYDIETGRDGNDVNISTRMLVEYYLPVFKTCVQIAKAKSIMCSYNAVNGVPSCANSAFQNDLLRDEWGWDGYIVSDCGAIKDIQDPHHYTNNNSATVAAALKGGTDLECDDTYLKFAAAALQEGAISVSDVDLAITRRLKHFIALGELEGPETVLYQTYDERQVDTLEHRLLSLSVAEQAMTLLKNEPVDGKPVLPISKGAKIALVGPQVNFTLEMLSNYEGENKLALNHSTLMVAQRAGLDVMYAPGHSLDVSNNDTSMIPAAVAAAKQADVAVVMVGLCADHCVGNGRTENEGNDRGPAGSGWHTLGLPGAQEQLLEAVVAVQPNTVLVMINGGMLDIAWAKNNVPAILEAYYPGQLGGDAIVNTLLGLNNPGGKTPVTWYPSSILERDMHDMDLTSGQGLTHLYYQGDVLWPFGYGLSYTTFSYEWLGQPSKAALSTSQFQASDIQYQCIVTNTGTVPGDAVVLGFVNSTDPDFPRQRLFDFDRVSLAPGEAKTVMLTITAEHMSVVDVQGRRWLQESSFTVRVGDVIQPAVHTFRVHGERVLLEDLGRFI